MTSANNMTEPFQKAFLKGFPHILMIDILTYTVSSSVLLVNGGIIFIFLLQRWRKPSKTRLSPAGMLVLNLLISDALVGVMGNYIVATMGPGYTLTRYGCATRVAVRFVFRMGSHMALINVAMDRYIAIMHTLHYREWVTMERSILAITLGWIVPLIGASYVYLGNDWRPGLIFCDQMKSFNIFMTYIRSSFHSAAFIFVVVIHCKIYFHLKNLKCPNSRQTVRKYSHKSARALFWVTTTYVICWLPFDIINMLLFLQSRTLRVMFDGSASLAHSSFLVNAFIFSYKTENIKKPVCDFCTDLKRAVFCYKGNSLPPDCGRPSIVTIGVSTKSWTGSSLNSSTTTSSRS